MRYQILLLITILSFSFIFAGCGAAETTTTNNSAATNTNANTAVVVNANNPVGTTTKPEAATTNDAPTLAPVVLAYYEAWKKKDDARLKKVFSQDTLKDFETGMKEDKKTSLSEWMSTSEQVPDKPFEIRNEKIEGDKATAELRGGSYGVWTPFVFVRENGEWKMTNRSPDFDRIKDAAKSSNTNAAK
jgi:hypothetical protein